MKSRILSVAIVGLIAASGAHASILSASSQAVPEPSMKSAGYWNAATLQQGLNASLREATDATAPGGSLVSIRPSIAGGGLLVNGGTSGAVFAPFGESAAQDGLFEMGNESGSLTTGSWSPSGIGHGGIEANGGHWGGGDWRRDRGGNPYATPEPATWMLLGSGLLFLGAYARLRRRYAMNF
jgi:hypothetical protein